MAAQGLSAGKELATLKHLLQAGYLTRNHLEKDKSIAQLHGHFAHSPTSVTMFASLLSEIPFSFTAHAKDIYTSDKEKISPENNQGQVCHNLHQTQRRLPPGNRRQLFHPNLLYLSRH